MKNAQTLHELVAANRILAKYGVLDGFGHVSVRDDENPDRFWISRSLAPELVTADDLLLLGLDGEPIDAQGRKSYAERFIHAEAYRARQDVISVIHSHAPSIIPFAATGVSLRPIYHMSSFLGFGVPIFEISDTGGDGTDMLVSSPMLGEALARTLGPSAVSLMRGHGMVVVGSSIREAVFRGIYTMQNAHLQAEALKLGTARFLSAAESKAATAFNAVSLERPWALWMREIGMPLAP